MGRSSMGRRKDKKCGPGARSVRFPGAERRALRLHRLDKVLAARTVANDRRPAPDAVRLQDLGHRYRQCHRTAEGSKPVALSGGGKASNPFLTAIDDRVVRAFFALLPPRRTDCW